jgi:hypothetical protein
VNPLNQEQDNLIKTMHNNVTLSTKATILRLRNLLNHTSNPESQAMILASFAISLAGGAGIFPAFM